VKTLSFEMREKPWSVVLEWLSDKAGLPVITSHKPAGNFTFIAPPGDQQYTIPQVIDIINDALQAQKLILINRKTSLTIVPADGKIDRALLPQIPVEDLDAHGNTELVTLVLPLTSLVAEEVAPEVKKLMGPFGEAVPLARANQLVLQDTVGNLKLIYKTLKNIEEGGKGQAESFAYTCKYIKVREAEKILREFLGDQRELIRLMTPPAPPAGTPAAAQPAGPPKIRMYYVTADERTNTLFINGSPDKISQAKEVLKKLDTPQPGQQPLITGPPILKTYTIESGTADALAKVLQDRYATAPQVRIAAAGNRSIVVWAGPDDQLEIARQLLGSSEKTTTIELIPVNGASVARVLAPLKELFADAKSSSFFFEADTTRNAILVKGTPEQITELKAALKLLVQGGAPATLELIPLTVLEPAKAVETLRTLFPDAKGGSLHLEAEPSRNAILVKGTPEQIAELKSALKMLDRRGTPAKLELIPLAVLEPAKAVETLKTLFPEAKRGTLFLEADPARNAILVKGTQEQIAEVKTSLKAMGDDGAAAGTTRIITIEKGSASAMAEALGRLLPQMRQNPVKVNVPGGGGVKPQVSAMNLGGTNEEQSAFEGQPPAAPAKPATPNDKPGRPDAPISISAAGNRLIVTSNDAQALALVQELVRLLEQTAGGEGDYEIIPLKHALAVDAVKVIEQTFTDPTTGVRRVRVVADPGSNSLLVRANLLDLISVRRIVENSVDKAPAGGPGELAILPLKTASAADAAKIIEQVFNDPKIDANRIRVVADAGSNKLLVRGTQQDIQEVRRLVENTIDQSPTSASSFETIPLTNGVASDIAKVLEQAYLDPKTGISRVRVVADTGSNAILVRAPKADLEAIRHLVQDTLDKPATGNAELATIALKHATATDAARVLEQSFTDPKTGIIRVRVAADAGSNSLLVRGSPQDIQVLRRLVENTIDQPPTSSSSFVTIPLTNGVASDVARVIELAYTDPKTNISRVRVLADTGSNAILVRGSKTDLDAIRRLVQETLDKSATGNAEFETIVLKHAKAPDAAKVLEQTFTDPKTGIIRVRVAADAASNSLLVRGSPQDLQVLRRLVQDTIDQPGASDSDVETYPLKNAVATDAAKFLEQTFTDPKTGTSRVRIVADAGSNALVIRGSKQDIQSIRNLLQTVVDKEPTGSKTAYRTWNIGPLKYSSAKDVSKALRELYKDHPDRALPAMQLTVRVEGQSNSLVLICSEPLYKDIKNLVDQMETAAKETPRIIKILPLKKGIDPRLLQQAIEAIQGSNHSESKLPRDASQENAPQMAQGRGASTPRASSGSLANADEGKVQPALLENPGIWHSADSESRSSPAGSGDWSSTDVPTAQTPSSSDGIQQVGFEQQQPIGPAGTTVAAPRSPVSVETLERLGIIVVSGNNPADVEEVIKLIERLQELGSGADVGIRLVHLEFGDATSLSTILTQLYQRVVVDPYGNQRGPLSLPMTPPLPLTGQQGPATQRFASVTLLPVPRLNAILLAAPQSRMQDIVKEIKGMDRPSSTQSRATPFPLKKASAARVAAMLRNFYAQRYPNETTAQNQVRVTLDESSNTVFVQAAPSDLAEIRDLIWRVDNTVSNAVNDLRVVYLRNALADELAALLNRAVSEGVVVPGPLGSAGEAAAPVPSTTPGRAGTTKATSLRFISSAPGRSGTAVESGLLEDVHILPDLRTNSLIISAPPRSMELLLAVVHEMDAVPSIAIAINIFPLKNADAGAMAGLLQQLMFGTGGPIGQAGTASVVGALGANIPSAAPRGVPRPIQLSLGGTPPEGAPLIELRITTDPRTNSVIVAGSRSDLEVATAIISRLEDSDVESRHNEVYALKNGSATDVANSLQSFLTSSIQVYQRSGQLTSYKEIEREVVVIPDPVSNKLLISATPRYFAEVMRLIQELDVQMDQVVIQVLIAEVDLSSTEEFGAELGLQSPILFSRSIIPANGYLGSTGTVNYASPGIVPTGVTINNSINPIANPGFNFNNISQPLGNNPVSGPGIVGFQGLTNLGVGRANSNGLGGFVFSAASNTFNLLIRTLKTQGRIEILSRPQVQTLNNQTAYLNIGQSVPYVTGSTVIATGLVTNQVTYKDVGVLLHVTPRINADGTVLMRVVPEVSSVSPQQVNLGNGVLATQFDVQHLETTVSARDGETIAIGGLITKHDVKMENKIPWLGDLPIAGALFRYRSHEKDRTELLLILTPHIVHSEIEADRILAEEARKLEWTVSDVLKIHGSPAMNTPHQPGNGNGENRPPLSAPVETPALPPPASEMPLPIQGPTPPGVLPPPRMLPSRTPDAIRDSP